MILEGKTIIVTGGASGIGRATCVLAAREGANVAIADINREMAEETARLVEVQGKAALVIEMDTSKKADAQRMVDETVGTFGTIDGIVCSAIKLVPGKLEELPEEDWDMVMDIGLKGYFLCAQAAGRVMLEKGSGSIVFVSSIGGVHIKVSFPLAELLGVVSTNNSLSSSTYSALIMLLLLSSMHFTTIFVFFSDRFFEHNLSIL